LHAFTCKEVKYHKLKKNTILILSRLRGKEVEVEVKVEVEEKNRSGRKNLGSGYSP
jgi:hypothetical protein